MLLLIAAFSLYLRISGLIIPLSFIPKVNSSPFFFHSCHHLLSSTPIRRAYNVFLLTKFWTIHFGNPECQAFKQMKYIHKTHPVMPTIPSIRDSGNVSGHSAGIFSSSFPSEMECVVQPEDANRIVPTGKAEFLLSTTLKDKAHEDMRNLFLFKGVGTLCTRCTQRALRLIFCDWIPYPHLSIWILSHGSLLLLEEKYGPSERNSFNWSSICLCSNPLFFSLRGVHPLSQSVQNISLFCSSGFTLHLLAPPLSWIFNIFLSTVPSPQHICTVTSTIL